MVSLIRLLLSFFRQKRIIQVQRLPHTKTIRAHTFGLTFAVLFAIIAVVANFAHIFTNLPIYVLTLLLLIVMTGTLVGGPFLAIVILYTVLFRDLTGTWYAFHFAAKWYLWGYVFGAVWAILYNDFVFIHTIIFNSDKVRIAFAFDLDKKVNVIKSPFEKEELAMLYIIKPVMFYTQKISRNERIDAVSAKEIIRLIRNAYKRMRQLDKDKLLLLLPGESKDGIGEKLDNLKNELIAPDFDLRKKTCTEIENNIEPLIENYLNRYSRKLYDYKVEPPVAPYTIAFVANPKIFSKKGLVKNDTDPIIKNVDLFLRAIDMALYSFEQNEILGLPEIWSKIRIVAVFDEKLATARAQDYALVQPNSDIVEFDDIIADNLLVPTKNVKEIYQRIVRSSQADCGLTSENVEAILRDTDVIYAMSAVPDYTRSCSCFTDWQEDDYINPSKNAPGKIFSFDPDPEHQKENEIAIPAFDADSPFSCLHEYFAKNPGRIALNVLGANIKTYIHEFAHAMSSAYHGAIVDEYFDRLDIVEPENEAGELNITPFYINRIERKKIAGKIAPTHKIFARYNGILYPSDLAHPSSEENWIGYFPGRVSPFTSCIMDRTYLIDQFDELLGHFIYERLMTKINRPIQ